VRTEDVLLLREPHAITLSQYMDLAVRYPMSDRTPVQPRVKLFEEGFLRKAIHASRAGGSTQRAKRVRREAQFENSAAIAGVSRVRTNAPGTDDTRHDFQERMIPGMMLKMILFSIRAITVLMYALSFMFGRRVRFQAFAPAVTVGLFLCRSMSLRGS